MIKLLSIGLILSVAIPSLAADKKKEKQQKKFQKSHKAYVHIPKGEVVQWRQGEIDTISSGGFYMLKREVSNFDYREFVTSIRNKFGQDSASKLLPDTTQWGQIEGFLDPLTQHYNNHPAYANYPVVNVTKAQALAFCQWQTEEFNKIEDRQYAKVKFRLPTEEEWEYAATGGLNYSPFPWGGPYMRNAQGCYLANILHLSDSDITRDSTGKLVVDIQPRGLVAINKHTNDMALVTAPVESYWPNSFGLYNMSGNVEEMVQSNDFAKGGSWRDPGYFARITSRSQCNAEQASPKRGFRIVMEVVNY